MTNLLTKVDAEIKTAKGLNPIMALGMLAIRKMIVEGDRDVISFHRCNNLKPSLYSCTAKIFEEIGELMELLGKGQCASGEKTPDLDHAEWVYSTIGEAFDGIQSLTTLVFLLADENNVDIQGEIGRHEAKLIAKGYLRDNKVNP